MFHSLKHVNICDPRVQLANSQGRQLLGQLQPPFCVSAVRNSTVVWPPSLDQLLFWELGIFREVDPRSAPAVIHVLCHLKNLFLMNIVSAPAAAFLQSGAVRGSDLQDEESRHQVLHRHREV